MSTHAEFWEPSQVSHFRPFCVAFRIFHFLRNEHPLDDAPGVRPFYFWRARQLRLEGFRNLLFSTEAMGPETLIVRVGFVLSWPCFASISQNTCCIKERLVLLRLNPMGQDMASQSPSWLCLDGWQALELRLIFHKLLPHSHNLTAPSTSSNLSNLAKRSFSYIFIYFHVFFFRNWPRCNGRWGGGNRVLQLAVIPGPGPFVGAVQLLLRKTGCFWSTNPDQSWSILLETGTRTYHD